MRILIINTLESGGGSARIARWLAAGLHSRGHQVAFVVREKTSSEDFVLELPSCGVNSVFGKIGRSLIGRMIHQPSESARTRHYWRRVVQKMNPVSQYNQLIGREDFSLPGCRGLLAKLPFEPEVINLQNLHAFNGLTHFDLRVLPELARQRGLVLSLNDTWFMTGHCAHPFTCEKWRQSCGECPLLSMYPALRRDGTTANLQFKASIYRQLKMHVAGPSDWIVDMAKQSILRGSLLGAHVIRHGVDLTLFTPAPDRETARRNIGVRPGERVITYIADRGRASPYRDYGFVERTIQRLVTDPKAHPLVLFEIGGAKSEQTKGSVRTIGTGHLGYPQIAQIMQASDAILHPALGDTYPTVVMEAMACGTPAVTTTVCGIPEQIIDGVDGFLHDVGDLDRAVEALKILFARDQTSEAIRAAARARAEKQFQEQPYLDAYETLLAQAAAGR